MCGVNDQALFQVIEEFSAHKCLAMKIQKCQIILHRD